MRGSKSAIVLFFLWSLFTQNLLADSLPLREANLTSMPPDTIKVNLLNELGDYYCSRDFEKSLLYLQQALVISSDLNYQPGIASSFLWQGRAYYYKDEYAVALEYLEKAKTIFEKLNDNRGLAEYFCAIGSIHSINGNFQNTLNDYQEAIKYAEMAGDKQLLSQGYMSLGGLYMTREELELAMEFHQKALKMKTTLHDSTGIAIIFTNIGKDYEILGKNDSAFYYLEKGYEIRKLRNEERGMASSCYIIGQLLIKTGDFKKALIQLSEAKHLFELLKDDTGIAICLVQIAKVQNELVSFSAAEETMLQALTLAKKIRNPRLISQTCGDMADLYAAAGMYEKAYGFKLQQNHLKDSLQNANNERIIREMDVKFRTAKKDDEIRLLKSENEIQHKNLLLLSVSVIGLIVILVLILFLLRLKSAGYNKQKQLLEQEQTINQQQTELKNKEQLLLREQLEAKNRELASKALEMLRMNETISDIIEKLESFNSGNHDDKAADRINSIINGLENQLRDNSWNEFEKIFRNIHSTFFRRLLEICPDLTPSEIKVAAFLKLNLNTKEIAAVTYKSEAGIKSTRYRLRKKLELQSDDSLVPYLMKL